MLFFFTRFEHLNISIEKTLAVLSFTDHRITKQKYNFVYTLLRFMMFSFTHWVKYKQKFQQKRPPYEEN